MQVSFEGVMLTVGGKHSPTDRVLMGKCNGIGNSVLASPSGIASGSFHGEGDALVSREGKINRARSTATGCVLTHIYIYERMNVYVTSLHMM